MKETASSIPGTASHDRRYLSLFPPVLTGINSRARVGHILPIKGQKMFVISVIEGEL
jgi:hypothetical protein